MVVAVEAEEGETVVEVGEKVDELLLVELGVTGPSCRRLAAKSGSDASWSMAALRDVLTPAEEGDGEGVCGVLLEELPLPSIPRCCWLVASAACAGVEMMGEV